MHVGDHEIRRIERIDRDLRLATAVIGSDARVVPRGGDRGREHQHQRECARDERH